MHTHMRAKGSIRPLPLKAEDRYNTINFQVRVGRCGSYSMVTRNTAAVTKQSISSYSNGGTISCERCTNLLLADTELCRIFKDYSNNWKKQEPKLPDDEHPVSTPPSSQQDIFTYILIKSSFSELKQKGVHYLYTMSIQVNSTLYRINFVL